MDDAFGATTTRPSSELVEGQGWGAPAAELERRRVAAGQAGAALHAVERMIEEGRAES